MQIDPDIYEGGHVLKKQNIFPPGTKQLKKNSRETEIT